MQVCGERIECINLMPVFLRFDGDCLIVLRESLLAVSPFEGCALLLGDDNQKVDFARGELWNIKFIWPCCNIWKPNFFKVFKESTGIVVSNEESQSKRNRFALDPREQIHAQRWARKRNWKVLGSAHSHPGGPATPSAIDHLLGISPKLMVIVSGSGLVRSWWIEGPNPNQKIEVTNLTI